MKLETLKIESLRPDPENARAHDEKNLKAIAGSLQQFGQRKPIVITKDNVIVAGNGTVEAAKRLQWETIQAVRVPENWTVDQIKAFALADNRTAELATWNQSILEKQLLELDRAGIQIAEFGFEVPDIPLTDVLTYEDEAPATPEDPKTKIGDIWKLGNHRLVCGDALDHSVISKALDGEKADCVFTDPPYNVAYEGGTKDKLTIQNDDMSDAEFSEFLYKFYKAALDNTKEGGPIYVCHADGSGNAFRNSMLKSGWLLKQVLIWAKDSLVLSRQDYNWQHEPILYGWKPGAAHSWYGPFTNTTLLDTPMEEFAKLKKEELVDILTKGFETSTIIREKRPRRNDLHPTMKPIALVARLLKNSCLAGDRVLDPFAGSGSTLITCEQLGLKAAVVELDPKYCDVIVQRWENLTGLKAELVNG
jgi:site-specific DNA-methyltransferase (adenine-specific)